MRVSRLYPDGVHVRFSLPHRVKSVMVIDECGKHKPIGYRIDEDAVTFDERIPADYNVIVSDLSR